MRFLFAFFFLLLSFTGFAQAVSTQEGYVNVTGGRIWYKIIGKGSEVPLLVIHGGPGSRSCESIPVYSALANDRPIIFYDQLGSGYSDRPTDTSLWNLARFVDEVTAIREALNLKQVHLLGNSWGAAIAVEYLLTQEQEGVASVIFSGPLLSTPIWMKDAKLLLQQMPQPLQDTINKYEALQQYNAPAYVAATDSFYARYLSRKQWPPQRKSGCEDAAPFNAQVYQYMWGATEFAATGTLKNFDRLPRLHELKLPVLFIAGEYDEARPETMYFFQKKVRKSKVAIIEGAGHAKTLDNPDAYLKAVRVFVNGVSPLNK